MDIQLQAIVTILALVNPAMCAAIFMREAGQQPRGIQLASATQAALMVLTILMVAALFGSRILHMFGVSLDAFSVAGGGVLAWIGFSMLAAKPEDNKPVPSDASETKPSLTPLILFAASPGTITGVITLAVAHARLEIPVTALIAVAVATVALWVVLIAAIYLQSRKRTEGSGFVRDTVTRFMGLIVIAMGVQFALTGIRSFMQ